MLKSLSGCLPKAKSRLDPITDPITNWPAKNFKPYHPSQLSGRGPAEIIQIGVDAVVMTS
jgi:hypothetical protein